MRLTVLILDTEEA